MPEKDQILIQRTLSGERNAFGDLVERYSALVRGLLLEATRQPDVVEDLLQEVFCKAYENLTHLRQPARFAAWLARMAVNQAQDWRRNQWRRHRKEGADPVLELVDRTRSPEEILEAKELSGTLWEALDHLEPDHRRIVVLYHLEGCTLRAVARFLGLSITTVKWRLVQAQRRLRKELVETPYKEAVLQAQRPLKKRHRRDQVMAVLPVVAFFRPEPDRLAKWIHRLVLPFVGVGTLGLLGLVSTDMWESWEKKAVDGGIVTGMRVHREVMELPEVSLLWEPRRPRAGERIRLEAAGPGLPEEGQKAELHYITDPEFPVDRVVVMRREGDAWVAEFTVSPDASAVFFHVSPAGEVPAFDRLTSWNFGFEKVKVGRYTGSFLVHDEHGRPVQDAAFKQAWMALRRDQSDPEILACLGREVAHHPENFRAQHLRWQWMLGAREDRERTKARMEEEMQEFKTQFAEDPEAFGWLVRLPSLSNERFYQELRTRFPAYERLGEAAYWVARNALTRRDSISHVRVLKHLIAAYPDSRYRDEAYRGLLMMLKDTDPGQAIRLAEDLIFHRVKVSYDPAQQRDQIVFSLDPSRSRYAGVLPEGLAYSLRFEFFLQDGDISGALDLARRLATSGMRDPYPYVYIGRQLAGEEFWYHLFETPAACPRDLSLALRLLQAGLPWTEVEHHLSLPGFYIPSDEPEHAREMKKRSSADRALRFRREFLRILGRCYGEQQDVERAAPLLQEALDVSLEWDPWGRDPELPLQAARVWEQIGEWEKAAHAYMDVLRQVYSHPEAEAALVRLHEAGHGRGEDFRSFMDSLCPVAPDFELMDPHGQAVRLSDFRGRPVLLCYETSGLFLERMKTMEQWKQRLASEQVEVLYVLTPGPGWRYFQSQAQKWHDPFPLVLDDGRFFEQYRAVQPSLFVIDAHGRLRLWLPLKEVMRDERAFQTVREKLESCKNPEAPVAAVKK